MTDTNTRPEDELQSLVKKLNNVDFTRIAEDGAEKSDALRLARKVTAILEGSVNRATDLAFRVYTI
jgi:hypothetical protein